MNKRGISSIVATVLIILITVAAISMIWVFVLPMIKENVSIDTRADLSISTEGGYSVYDSSNHSICLQIDRGTDNTNLIAIEFIFSIEGDTSTVTLPTELKTNQKKTYCFDNVSGNLESVSIAPVIVQGTTKKVGAVISQLNDLPKGDLSSFNADYYNLGLAGNSTECVPNCESEGKVCGSDGCGGICGTCGNGNCQEGQCVECTPECADPSTVQCGTSINPSNGCGTCLSGTLCSSGSCQSGHCATPSAAVSYWKGEGNADDVYNKNPGSWNYNSDYAPGISGSAFSFGGSGCVDVPNLDMQTFTFMAWVKRASLSCFNCGDEFLLDSPVGGYTIYFPYQGRLTGIPCLSKNGIWAECSNSEITDTDWHHIGVTWNGTDVCFFVDARLTNCVNHPDTFSSYGDYCIGGGGSSWNYFNGMMDEVRLYNVPLNQSAIYSAYKTQAGCSNGEYYCGQTSSCYNPSSRCCVNADCGTGGYCDTSSPDSVNWQCQY